ncbi:DUF192 domain-containing protein [Candidatus Saccharibacteria bacterium]|nr:MAG: DUF192 domain-containing protein [Candidatus Saccharibacteria bacterium]
MSNYVLEGTETKTASRVRVGSPALVSLVIIAVAIVITFLVVLIRESVSAGPRLQGKDTVYALEIADSEEERIRGLSGRERLAENSGMLFVFDPPQQACMWMKSMRFSIDMLWLDTAKKIINMSADVSPQTFPKLFCATKPASYVLELPSGTIAGQSFAVGQTLNIHL